MEFQHLLVEKRNGVGEIILNRPEKLNALGIGPGSNREEIAARELDGNIKLLSRTGEFKLEWVQLALDNGRMIGMKELADAKEVFVENFKPVPTKA